MASYLIKEFNNDPNIFIRSSLDNKVLNSTQTCTCGSVEFENDSPCTMNFDLGNFSQSFNFNLPLRRPYIEYKNEYIFISDILDDTDLVELDILDLRWNENKIWNILLDKIEKYNNHE